MSPLLSVLAGRPPGPSDRPDRTTIAMEHVDDDPSLCALTASCHRLSAFQEGAQLGDEREGATLAVLRRPGLEPDETPGEIDLSSSRLRPFRVPWPRSSVGLR